MLADDVPTLAEVSDAFTHWRQTRTRPRTPELLQQQVVLLLSHYRTNEVLKTLGLCHKNVKRWKQRWLPAQEEVSVADPAAFVALPMSAEIVSAALPVAAIELKLSRQTRDGVMLSLEGSLSKAQWHWALGLLHEGPGR
jgi:hypothetical protein